MKKVYVSPAITAITGYGNPLDFLPKEFAKIWDD